MSADLHPTIVAMVSLAANIAANHPKQGQCQLERLRSYGVSEEHIEAVVEIARHLRDEAAQALDTRFDALRDGEAQPAAGGNPFATLTVTSGESCCTPTPSGRSCC